MIPLSSSKENHRRRNKQTSDRTNERRNKEANSSPCYPGRTAATCDSNKQAASKGWLVIYYYLHPSASFIAVKDACDLAVITPLSASIIAITCSVFF
jgi:hypothetical protein